MSSAGVYSKHGVAINYAVLAIASFVIRFYHLSEPNGVVGYSTAHLFQRHVSTSIRYALCFRSHAVTPL